MNPFIYREQQLHAEGVALADIAASCGTPTYVYSRAAIEERFLAYDQAFGDRDHLVCYAVKANSNIAVLNALARLGSGFDIVSVGELERVIRAGGDPGKTVFSGVAKTLAEIARALEAGVHCFNVESEAELHRIADVASGNGVTAPISLRVNPDVDAQTHPYISTGLSENKFGINIEEARGLYQWAAGQSTLDVVGVDCHIGSQLTSLAPFADALDRVLALVDELEQAGIELQHIDVGGGLGIRYQNEAPPEPSDYVQQTMQQMQGRNQTILVEPGRSIVGNAGVLLARVEFLKQNGGKQFAIIDAAMNDMIRPALYGAWLDVCPLTQADGPSPTEYDVVGPVCETGDFLAKDRALTLAADDILSVMSAGAYGFTMASNYNSRPRAAEVMVDGENFYVVRDRETIGDLYRNEHLLP